MLRGLVTEFGGFERFFEAYTNGLVNSENYRVVSEASRTCEFDLWVEAGQADPPTLASPPPPTATLVPSPYRLP